VAVLDEGIRAAIFAVALDAKIKGIQKTLSSAASKIK
jgi:hypothetical protein